MLQIFKRFTSDHNDLSVFEQGKRTSDKQQSHTMDAVKLLEHDLKNSLVGLVYHLFGSGSLECVLAELRCVFNKELISSLVFN